MVSTDTAGASEIVFALAWALGYRWAPRLADLPDQRLWRIDREAHYGPLNGADGDPLDDAAARDWAVRDYRSYLVTVAKRATATVNKHLAALEDFYVWRGLGLPRGVRRHPVPRHAPKALGPRAKLRYLRAVEAWPVTRDRAIALLPLYAGTRIAEIAVLDLADVRLSARKGEVHLVGKGEKSRTVPVHARLREALAAWLADRPGASSAALFTAARGTRMTTDAIADVISAITTAAALDGYVSSHVLRHAFGTELTRSGVDLVTVAELIMGVPVVLGKFWSDISDLR